MEGLRNVALFMIPVALLVAYESEDWPYRVVTFIIVVCLILMAIILHNYKGD